MIYLVDTSIMSEVMRKKPDPRVDAWYRLQARIATSAVCIEELVFGLRRRSGGRAHWCLRLGTCACPGNPKHYGFRGTRHTAVQPL